MTPEMVNAGLAVAIVVVGCIGWFFRLENQVKIRESECKQKSEQHDKDLLALRSSLEKQIDEIKHSHAETRSTMWEQMNGMNEKLSKVLASLSKIEGKLEGDNRSSD